MAKKTVYLLAVVIFSIMSIAIYLFSKKVENQSETGDQKEAYTCSMHPEIIREKPGSCPICGMTLVKIKTSNYSVKDNSIDNIVKPTDSFIVGNYQTTSAIDTALSSEVNLPGIVEYDPNSLVNIAARISGRIERLYVNYKYQKVSKGQKLFDLYSPELLTEQQNLIYLISNDPENRSIVDASKRKLLLYGMTEKQIGALIESKTTNPEISIYSPVSGNIDGTETMYIASKSKMQIASSNTEVLNVKEGTYIKKGEVIFKLLDTDKVWGIFNIIQGYSSLIKKNEPIKITTELDKDEIINATVDFVETQFNPTNKTNRVRVYLNNGKLNLPIGLRLQGMMETEEIKGIWIRRQSMISIGNKKIVFIKMENGFKASTIKTGFEINDFVQVVEGISVKDIIAQNAQYLVDSESFVKTE